MSQASRHEVLVVDNDAAVISVARSADDKYFYVWRTQPKHSQATAPTDRVP